jgi:DNA-binding Lrp family transcriptional regulator
MDLDRLDRRLLNLVQHDSAQTAEQLSEHLGLSASAIQRRLRRLRESGVIQRDVAILAPDRIGKPTTFIATLQVESERPEMLRHLRRWLLAEERVQQAYYITGEGDFILIATAGSTEEYDELMTRLLEDNPNVRKFTTNVVLSGVKRGLVYPIDEG